MILLKGITLFTCFNLALSITASEETNQASFIEYPGLPPSVQERTEDYSRLEYSEREQQEFGIPLSASDYNFAAQVRFIGDLPLEWQGVYLGGDRSSSGARTPRSLCSATRYGGDPAFNLGMYCVFSTARNSYEPVKYAAQWDSSIAPSQLREMAVFCLLRSRCLQSPVPSYNSPISLEVKLDEASFPQYDMNPSPFGGAIPDVPVRFIRDEAFFSSHLPILGVAKEPGFGFKAKSEKSIMFSPEPQVYRAPTCKGSLPTRPLPYPFSEIIPNGQFAANATFNSVSTLCSAMWFGGDFRGNAGFVCKRSGAAEYALSAEEYLGHPSLLFSNGKAGLAVRAWCYRACTCEDNPEEGYERRTSAQIPLYGGTAIANYDADGVTSLILAGLRGGLGPPTILYLNSHPSDTCRTGRSGACPAKDWGNPCRKASECQNADKEREFCIFRPSAVQVQSAGLSPWLPRVGSICLPVFAVILGSSLSKVKGTRLPTSRGRGSMGGRRRGIEEQEDETVDTAPVQCACEDESISTACCEWHNYFGVDEAEAPKV
ncbi:MAG: hypothetical protein M1814_001220 [Vezdaea aestivalis]|nr:MAG: hypothetical protein M1814_001220 [Vezdaea aestivalis]